MSETKIKESDREELEKLINEEEIEIAIGKLNKKSPLVLTTKLQNFTKHLHIYLKEIWQKFIMIAFSTRIYQTQ